jgi:myo-inositol-1(or 4)-monophosphatase
MNDLDQQTEWLLACETAARRGGRILLDWVDRFEAREKGPADLVTEADFASQRAIREELLGRFPEHAFLGEESEAGVTVNASRDAECRWVVDPLDGTLNYVHRLRGWAVSIALEVRGELEVGCVYDPLNDECFTAARGRGAWLNGRPLKTSDVTTLQQALVVVSFQHRPSASSPDVQQLLRVLPVAQGVRRLGSAALSLCYLAAGQIDGYWSTIVSLWDVAAGALIVREAGGQFTGWGGRPFDHNRPWFVAAATTELHQELASTLGEYGEG